VKRIREATARIERLLGELLSLARIEARGAEAFEPVDVAKLTERAIDALDDGRARVVLDAGSGALVRGDESWLGRAITNLLDNALAFSEPGTKIDVGVRRDEGVVRVSVTSAGSVPPAIRPRLFRRFVTARPEHGGTGLGLAIVRAVAEAHGGRAELSLPGPPTVEFRLLLPVAFQSPGEKLRAAVSEAREGLSQIGAPASEAKTQQ
jgi:signal transduction histidine kinase